MAHRWILVDALTVFEQAQAGNGNEQLSTFNASSDLAGMTVMQGVADVGRRFPRAAFVLAQCLGNPGARTLISMLPNAYSVRKLDAAIKTGNPDAAPEEEEEEKPAPPPVAAPKSRKPVLAGAGAQVDTSDIDKLLAEE